MFKLRKHRCEKFKYVHSKISSRKKTIDWQAVKFDKIHNNLIFYLRKFNYGDL